MLLFTTLDIDPVPQSENIIAMFLEVVTLIQHLHADQYTSIPKIICMTVAISFYHLRSTHQLPCESKLVTTDYIKETQLTA